MVLRRFVLCVFFRDAFSERWDEGSSERFPRTKQPEEMMRKVSDGEQQMMEWQMICDDGFDNAIEVIELCFGCVRYWIRVGEVVVKQRVEECRMGFTTEGGAFLRRATTRVRDYKASDPGSRMFLSSLSRNLATRQPRILVAIGGAVEKFDDDRNNRGRKGPRMSGREEGKAGLIYTSTTSTTMTSRLHYDYCSMY